MRIAILSDIHSNALALEAVVRSRKFQKCDIYLNVGDAIGYNSNSSEVIQKLIDYNFFSIKGNHEELLIRALSNNYQYEDLSNTIDIGKLTKIEDLDSTQIEFIKNLPASLVLNDGEAKIHVHHGTPESIFQYLYPDFKHNELGFIIPEDCRWLILGNTHWPMIRYTKNTTILNPGSVGQPRNFSSNAHWAILDTTTSEICFLQEKY